ncbi:MAG: flagellar filament capping protein FliD [Acidobacteriota bacterium]
MGSPITLSGFNKIDFNVILNAVMEQARAPVTALETQKRALQAQSSAYSTLATRVSAVESAAKALSEASGLSGRKSSNTDTTAVTATTSSASTIGTYDIVVTELARAQVTASTSTYADKTSTVVATGGSITIGGTVVSISGDTTLQGLADAINGTTGIGVVASVVQTSGGNFQLVLTGTSTGTANAFAITNNLTGGAGLTMSGTNAVEATDASATVNGITVTSSTNVLENAIPGASLTVLKKDATKTITVTVERDDTATEGLVDKFVTAYNDLVQFVDDQTRAARAGGQTNIGRDSLLRGLRGTLRELLNADYTLGGSYTRLSTIGLEFQTTGKLSFDKTKFREATADAFADVEKLFAGTTATSGAFDEVLSAVTTYTQAGGLIPNARERVDAQVTGIDDRIATLEARLALRREALQREFIAADLAISQLNAQSQALSSLRF